jgi:predicted transposase YbfD/YdcC
MLKSALSVVRFFRPLRDPRRQHLRRHTLLDILVITLCAVISGANDWQQVVTFAQRRRSWLEGFLGLAHGIPSHDTFERVFDRLDPQVFQSCFRRWVEALTRHLSLEHIAIDGKTLRSSGNDPKGWKALHLVSAWASGCHLSLGQVAVDAKSNEITAIPQLLELLDLHGALVTIDAMGCQKEIAGQIIAAGGDYVLSVKDNQPNLLADIQACLGVAMENDFEGVRYDTYQTDDEGHGRKETRSYLIVVDPEGIRNQEAWAHLRVVGMYTTDCEQGAKYSSEAHYFMGSRVMSAQAYGKVLRGHWSIENNLHWQMDVVFREDDNRVQRRHGAENLALIRRAALGLLQQHPAKMSLPCKRLAAACDTDFLEEILSDSCKAGNP